MTDLTNALEMLCDVARTRLCRIADHAHLPAEQITCAGLPAPEQAGYLDQELDCALVRNGRIVDQKGTKGKHPRHQSLKQTLRVEDLTDALGEQPRRRRASPRGTDQPIAEVELRAVLGSDEVETYTVQTAGISAQSV